MSEFLVVLDADSTLIEDEVIELLADEAGQRERVAEITLRAMHGELDFAESLRERVQVLAGLPESIFTEVGNRIRPTPGVDELISGVHAHGGRIGVVSGGFHELLDPLHAQLGLDHCRANRLETEGGVLTGRVYGPVVDASAKAGALREWAAADGIPMHRTAAIGDGANDLEMLSAAALGIAFCAKPLVRERADVAIDTPDLSQALALLGLRG